jgi:hypothetical protein
MLLSLGLAALILAVGLAVLRPWQKPAPPVPPVAPPPVTVPPLALDGLRYLPATANVVLAVQPAPLVGYAGRTGIDAKQLLLAAGVPERVTGVLDQLGLPLDGIDQLVVGASLTNEALPGLTAVLRLRQPLADEDGFLRRMRAEKRPVAGRPVWTVSAGLPLMLTRMDGRTYLFALTDAGFAAADAPHPAGGGHLPKGLRETIADRLSPASFVWLATDAENWADKPALKLGLKKDQLERLARGRAAAVGVSLEPDPVLRVAVRAKDAATADEARGVLRERLGGAGGEGEWATAETPLDPKGEAVRKLVAGVIDK